MVLSRRKLRAQNQAAAVLEGELGSDAGQGKRVRDEELERKGGKKKRRKDVNGGEPENGTEEVEAEVEQGGEDDLEARRLRKKEKRANRRKGEEGKAADGGVGEVEGDDLEARRLWKKENRANRRKGEEGKPADGGVGEVEGDDLEARRLKKKEKRANRRSLEEGKPAGVGVGEGGQEGDGAAGNGEVKEKVEEEERTKKEKKKKKKQKSGVNRWGEKEVENVENEEQEQEQAVEGSGGEDVEGGYEKRKVLVGGMPYSVSEDDIVDYFAPCGRVAELDCVLFPDTGKFRGLAFITFETEAGARAALELDGADMGGRYLKIQRSKVKEVKAEKPRFEQPPPKHEGCTSAYIGNLAWDVTEEELRGFFKKCKITGMRFAHDKNTGEFKGFGHVDFADDRSLETAIAMDQQLVHGRPIKIAYAVPDRRGNKG